MKCKDCLYTPHCIFCDNKEFTPKERLCFSDRSEWVHLPCKVGQTVYKLWNCGKNGKSTTEFTVSHIDIDYLPEIEIAFTKKNSTTGTYHFAKLDDFGKTVFLTREEAEIALKERNGNDT